MLLTLLKSHWLQLCRDKVALFLVFVLPVVFFSVFAFIFGGTGGKSSEPADLKVAVWDLDQSDISKKLLQSLNDVDGIEAIAVTVQLSASEDPRLRAARPVQSNSVDAAVVLPAGLADSIGTFSDEAPAVEVIYDSANPMAEAMLTGVLQGAVFTALPDRLMIQGLDQFREFGGPFSEQQQQAVDFMRKQIEQGQQQAGDEDEAESSNSINLQTGLLPIRTTSARELVKAQSETTRSKKQGGSMVAYYAAGVAVMFLMFSMAGAASSLLADQENGTLDRLISGQMSIATLIVAHWTYYVLMGLMQLVVMFAFAAVVFRVDLTSGRVLLGLVSMSIVTSMASAAFVMLLATLCRSRKQLESISTTIILVMSAFGGSMIPRPFLPKLVRETSKVTFNGWALDGYQKVLWYSDPTTPVLSAIGLHLVVITLMAAAFLWLAIWRAKRWAYA